MRVIHVKPAGLLSADARKRLEAIFSSDSEASVREIQGFFPTHHVSAKYGHIQVAGKDGSIFLDAFRDGNEKTHWIETNVPLRMSVKLK